MRFFVTAWDSAQQTRMFEFVYPYVSIHSASINSHPVTQPNEHPRPKHIIRGFISNIEIALHILPLLRPLPQALDHRPENLPSHGMAFDVYQQPHVTGAGYVMQRLGAHGNAIFDVDGHVSLCCLEDSQNRFLGEEKAIVPELQHFVREGNGVVVIIVR